jgi:predicted HicB family RNase H-like nuclease
MNTANNKQPLVHFGGKLPKQTHIAVKKHAAEHGITLNKLYNQALLQYLDQFKECEECIRRS